MNAKRLSKIHNIMIHLATPGSQLTQIFIWHQISTLIKTTKNCLLLICEDLHLDLDPGYGEPITEMVNYFNLCFIHRALVDVADTNRVSGYQVTSLLISQVTTKHAAKKH